MTGIRGYNPIWAEFDLTGNLFDDTFYMFVLQNTIPYMPADVYHDPQFNVAWNNPIQFLANGTLPVDIYFDADKVYRLEFRKGDTQSDPLIYEINDYVPGSGGDIPVDTTASSTENQITNPQFSLLSFNSPLELVSTSLTVDDPIQVAPGWELILNGTGNLTLTREALTSTQPTPTNAPYALHIELNGWTDPPYLRQKFDQNGVQWSTFIQKRYVSNSVTAKVGGVTETLLGQLYDSQGTALTTVLKESIGIVSTNYNEFVDHGEMPIPSNTDTPPDASIEYRLYLNDSADIYISSIQLVTSNSINDFNYIQDTIERQQDYTFHYYRDSLLRQQKQSILTGWDFALNPWQSYTVADTNLATFGYTADQTIMVQQAYVASATGNNIKTGRTDIANNYAFKVTAVTAANQFAMIQYIDLGVMRPLWGKIMSSMVTLHATLQNSALPMRVKMRLIYRSSLPNTLAQADPIASWTALSSPVYSSGWSEIAAINDPVYNLTNGANTLLFEGFELPVADNDNMTLAIVIYTLDSMVQTGTADIISFNQVSLVQNEFAIQTPSLTAEETLNRCRRFYWKTFPGNIVPAQNAGLGGALICPQTVAAGSSGFGPAGIFPVQMRAIPTITLYNPSAANAQIRNTSVPGDWVSSEASINVSTNGFTSTGTSNALSGVGNGAAVHATANARLGM